MFEWLKRPGSVFTRPCPCCGSRDVEAERVSRPPGQCDGLDGIRYTCRACGRVWAKPLAPVV